MSDDADRAAEMTAFYEASAIREAARPIPVGEPGECDECGEDSLRLVAGRCAYCRDGRTRPM